MKRAIAASSLWLCACAGDLEDDQRFAVRDPVIGSQPAGTAVPLEPVAMQGLAVPTIDGGAGFGVAGADAGSEAPADAGPAPAPVPACVINLLKSGCTSGSCHGPGSPQVDLISPYLTERLIDEPAPEGSPCSGQRIIATDGSEGLLLAKLEDSPACGDRMPPSGKLNPPQTRCLTSWVQSLQRDDLDGGGP